MKKICAPVASKRARTLISRWRGPLEIARNREISRESAGNRPDRDGQQVGAKAISLMNSEALDYSGNTGTDRAARGRITKAAKPSKPFNKRSYAPEDPVISYIATAVGASSETRRSSFKADGGWYQFRG